MTEKLTPREEFEKFFGAPITSEEWQWLKEFCSRNYIPNGDEPGQVVLEEERPSGSVPQLWSQNYLRRLIREELTKFGIIPGTDGFVTPPSTAENGGGRLKP